MTRDKIASVAGISSADSTIGETLAEAFDRVGKDGVHLGRGIQTRSASTSNFTEGMQFDKGFLSPYFVTDPDRQEGRLRRSLPAVS